jgi:hypothetical protein
VRTSSAEFLFKKWKLLEDMAKKYYEATEETKSEWDGELPYSSVHPY